MKSTGVEEKGRDIGKESKKEGNWGDRRGWKEEGMREDKCDGGVEREEEAEPRITILKRGWGNRRPRVRNGWTKRGVDRNGEGRRDITLGKGDGKERENKEGMSRERRKREGKAVVRNR